MSKGPRKCPACSRRIRRGRQANVRIRERESESECRYHGARIECLQAAALFMSQHSRNSLTIHYFHAAGCTAREKFTCGCFAVDSQGDVLLDVASPGEAKIVKVGEE
jgi:hypothetical protein